MQTELWTISKIFTENLFRIPDYQRGYAWGERQLKDFWNDIELLEPNKNHYTGVITLEDVPPINFNKWEDDLWIINSKKYKPYYVVDGQQRLTTIVVLLQCIIERLQEGEQLNYFSKLEIRKKFIYDSKGTSILRSYLFGYEKDNPSYEFLKIKIFGEQSENHSLSEQTIYTKNLESAKSFFSERLSGIAVNQVEAIFTKITQCFLFNIYVISDDIDVFIAFETMNNRGKPLSDLELLKNRLIFLSTRLDSSSEEKQRLRKATNEAWKTAYHFIGKSGALVDDRFLNIQSILYFKGIEKVDDEMAKEIEKAFQWPREKGYRRFLLDVYFTTRNIKHARSLHSKGFLDAKILHKYVLDIKAKVEVFVNIVNPSIAPYPDIEKTHLARINRLKRFYWGAMTLLVSLYSGPCQSEKGPLLKLIEKMLFMASIKTNYSLATDFNFEEHALNIRNDKEAVKTLTRSIEEQIQVLLREIDFKQAFAEITRTADQYYGWRPLKFFLFEYEQQLQSQSKTNRQKLVWAEFDSEDYEVDFATIEHIYPKTAKEKCWKTPFESFTVPQRNSLRNSLGNLLPLSKAKNSSLRNDCFAKKKGDARNKVGYSYGCYSEIEVSHSEKWDAEEIALRGIRMLNFLEERWELDLGDAAEKLELLGLGFLRDLKIVGE